MLKIFPPERAEVVFLKAHFSEKRLDLICGRREGQLQGPAPDGQLHGYAEAEYAGSFLGVVRVETTDSEERFSILLLWSVHSVVVHPYAVLSLGQPVDTNGADMTALFRHDQFEMTTWGLECMDGSVEVSDLEIRICHLVVADGDGVEVREYHIRNHSADVERGERVAWSGLRGLRGHWRREHW